MRNKGYLSICLLLSLLLSSCSSGQSRRNSGLPGIKPLENGKVTPAVICIKDPATSYSVYLPKSYSEQKKFPVILAFDPQGSGNIPVEKYKDLAERYGTILIGSNNSKNGQPINETENIIYSLFEEMGLRFSLDSTRIYVMGFSGGARVASLIALYRGGTRGMIGCGAGFSGSDQPARFRFDYIGFAGNADFNMNELINLDEQLEKANFRHALVIFDGKHEWPPVEIMEYAFLWNEFCAMKDGSIDKNIYKIADFLARVRQTLQQAEDQHSLYQKKLALQLMIRFLQGLDPVDKEKKELKELLSTENYKKEEKKINTVKEKEMQEQQMFTENFFVRDSSWWKKKITNYELRITNGKDQQDVLMCKRIMSYLSLLAYMNYSNASKSGAKEKADFALHVYRLVDPENAAKIK